MYSPKAIKNHGQMIQKVIFNKYVDTHNVKKNNDLDKLSKAQKEALLELFRQNKSLGQKKQANDKFEQLSKLTNDLKDKNNYTTQPRQSRGRQRSEQPSISDTCSESEWNKFIANSNCGTKRYFSEEKYGKRYMNDNVERELTEFKKEIQQKFQVSDMKNFIFKRVEKDKPCNLQQSPSMDYNEQHEYEEISQEESFANRPYQIKVGMNPNIKTFKPLVIKQGVKLLTMSEDSRKDEKQKNNDYRDNTIDNRVNQGTIISGSCVVQKMPKRFLKTEDNNKSNSSYKITREAEISDENQETTFDMMQEFERFQRDVEQEEPVHQKLEELEQEYIQRMKKEDKKWQFYTKADERKYNMIYKQNTVDCRGDQRELINPVKMLKQDKSVVNSIKGNDSYIIYQKTNIPSKRVLKKPIPVKYQKNFSSLISETDTKRNKASVHNTRMSSKNTSARKGSYNQTSLSPKEQHTQQYSFLKKSIQKITKQSQTYHIRAKTQGNTMKHDSKTRVIQKSPIIKKKIQYRLDSLMDNDGYKGKGIYATQDHRESPSTTLNQIEKLFNFKLQPDNKKISQSNVASPGISQERQKYKGAQNIIAKKIVRKVIHDTISPVQRKINAQNRSIGGDVRKDSGQIKRRSSAKRSQRQSQASSKSRSGNESTSSNITPQFMYLTPARINYQLNKYVKGSKAIQRS